MTGNPILDSALILGGVGLFFGFLIAMANKKFYVWEDPRIGEVEELLADGRGSILGGDEPNFSDFTYASIMGLWLQPGAYGGGMAENVKVPREDFPEAMQREIESWIERFPRNVALIEKLYSDARRAGG